MAIERNVSEQDYNKIEGARSTILSIIDKKTLAHAKYAIENPIEETSSLIFGRAAHDYFLRRGLFESKWGIFPEGHNGTTKEGKAAKAKLQETYGENLLKHDELELIKTIVESTKKHPSISALLEGVTDTELTLDWKENGIPCKARIDAVTNIKGETLLLDIKTARSASPQDFSSSCVNYGYLIQSAHYLAGAKENGLIKRDNNNFLHILLEKEPPYLCAVYCLDDATLELAERRREDALKKYWAAIQCNQWPGYSEDIESSAAPHWYFQQQDFV